ncbi:hypothetical protein TPHA_0I02380 [Tetrapisispora phaffii CBS 4417]|uniref:4a-hydroxytetrahydrobiopterin dehydratase n=1 Tax=Tetrapisispora phaffii (strain ATCC 24235 / CBS 4417 / NBRC 1672 / NRRL Y-8282 / UCD 70-5) TaxID=1071381 RepID=G8BXW3_TETPH|nr:hypothetical protein TPHA_0I02380 [Tetrapisispora phaffii CBS 4417]CCE64741.1 hypothetical protein TPHA_0I02380 [Tetrapisispora phaffii CBS 4417]
MYNKILKVKPSLLSKTELAEKLLELPKWRAHEGHLIRQTIEVKDFEICHSLFNNIAMRSHLWGHHPRITMNYNKLDLTLTTHDIGTQISDIDIKLAKRIDTYVERYSK